MTASIFDFEFMPTKFDKFQKEAILSKHSTSLINAGAGSGKTTTILGRIIYIIAEKKTPIEEIAHKMRVGVEELEVVAEKLVNK